MMIHITQGTKELEFIRHTNCVLCTRFHEITIRVTTVTVGTYIGDAITCSVIGALVPLGLAAPWRQHRIDEGHVYHSPSI